MITRDEFLLKVWIPFPSAEDGWVDVATYSRNSTGLACGRLTKKASSWQIASGGASVEFQFSKSCSWLKTKTNAVFDEAVFADGDLVCIELRDSIAQQCLLLVPSRTEWNLRSHFSVQRSRDWAKFLQTVREFFSKQEFVEAATPTLVPSPGTEPFLDPFKTDWVIGAKRSTFYLPTSPEFHLKKMLASGWTKIFELKNCFRNGEIGEHHQPEFLMLEWYRAFASLDHIAKDVAALIDFCAKKLGGSSVPTLKLTTMAELFANAFDGFRLTPKTSRDELVALATQVKVRVEESDTWDEVFFRLFLEKIEVNLGVDGPLLVRGYPPSQAALSRIGPDGFADRFEVYWRGLEIANAFHELNDPAENRKRFAEDRAGKLALGKEPVPFDEELLRALDYGMPPSGGIALGLDRLFMALFNIDTIEDTRAFPL